MGLEAKDVDEVRIPALVIRPSANHQDERKRLCRRCIM